MTWITKSLVSIRIRRAEYGQFVHMPVSRKTLTQELVACAIILGFRGLCFVDFGKLISRVLISLSVKWE